MPKILGLTGTIGSGKSTVAKLFEQLGARIIDADQLARVVVKPNSDGLKAVIDYFGIDYLSSNGELDRKKLGQLVFSDTKHRAKLESILHPLIRKEFTIQLGKLLSEESTSHIVAVIPLLFETNNSYPELEKIIVVAANSEICIERIMERDKCDAFSAKRKLAAQMPIEEKIKKADYVIDNNNGLEELKKQVKHCWQQLATLC